MLLRRSSVSLLLVVSLSLAAPEPTDSDQEPLRGDEAFLKEHRVALDAAALLDFFRQRTLTDAGRQEVEGLVRQLGSERFELREQASRELAKRGPVVLPFLRAARKDADPEIRRRAEQCIGDIEQGPGSALPTAAVRVLAAHRPAGAVAALLGYVPFAGDEGVEDEVLNALAALTARAEKVDPALIAALKDGFPQRRAAAAFALGQRKEQRAAVRPLLTDADARVRLRAAQGLVLGGDKDAVPVLLELLADGPEELTWRAEELLQRLAGEDAPALTVKAGNAPDRAAWRDAWRRWWKENGERADLGRLTQAPAPLGLTLCVEWNTNRVYECGRDGKVRWQLQVNGPLDAQMLPGNRVLVAESAPGRVTERDLQGNVLWEYKVEGEALNCRRLPNGNTFVGTRNAVLEVTRQGQVVARHMVDNAYFHAVTRTHGGHFVYLTSTGTLGELDAAGKQVRSLALGKEGSWGDVEALPGGRYLVCNYGSGRVFEIDAAGKVQWEQQLPGACGVSRLPNSTTLVACSARAAEIDRTGRVLWERLSDGFVRRAHRR
jgi:HEAT repeat protein